MHTVLILGQHPTLFQKVLPNMDDDIVIFHNIRDLIRNHSTNNSPHLLTNMRRQRLHECAHGLYTILSWFDRYWCRPKFANLHVSPQDSLRKKCLAVCTVHEILPLCIFSWAFKWKQLPFPWLLNSSVVGIVAKSFSHILFIMVCTLMSCHLCMGLLAIQAILSFVVHSVAILFLGSLHNYGVKCILTWTGFFARTDVTCTAVVCQAFKVWCVVSHTGEDIELQVTT